MKVIPGGLSDVMIGAVTVSFLAEDEAYRYVPDADVEEQDRYLSLSKPRDIILDDANPLRTFTRLHEEKPRDLGSVHLLRGVLRAVVIDVDAEQPCHASDVRRAASEIVRVARAAKLVNVRMPVLGTRHGGLALEHASRAIAEGFSMTSGEEPLLVAIVAPRDLLPIVAENFTATSSLR